MKALQVDQRNTQQLLKSLLSTYAQIPFEEDGRVKGQWDAFFKEQLLFYWVDIYEANLFWWQKEREIILKNWESHGRLSSADYLSKQINTFYEWYRLAERYQQWWIIKEMKSCLLQLDLSEISRLLDFKKERQEALGKLEQLIQRTQLSNRLGFRELPQKRKFQFEHISNQLLNCLLQVQKELKTKDWDALISTENHPAHIGLMYGFIKAYEEVQAQINKLPQRHLDYYIKDILKHQPAIALADEVFLFFHLSDRQKNFVLPQHSKLKGYGDNGEEIIFETYENTYLTNAVITETRSLVMDSSPEIEPLHHVEGITSIYQVNIPADQITDHLLLDTGWSLFDQADHKTQTEIGWAIASPAFFSFSGNRLYKLTLELEEASVRKFNKLFHQLYEQSDLSKDQLAFKFFNDTLNLRVTGGEGWKVIGQYDFDYEGLIHKQDNKISINFRLTSSDVDWVNYSKAIHLGDYDTSYPLLEICLKEKSVYYPYSLMQQLKWQSIDIEVDVCGSESILFYNKQGLIDTSTPFPLFGLEALKDDPFYLGSKEWTSKSLKTLDLILQWENLPQPNLKSYYADYETIGIDDADFEVEFKTNTGQNHREKLFSLSESGELNEQTRFENVIINKKSQAPSLRNEELIEPFKNPMSFLDLSLVAPTVGFGSGHYTEELSLYAQRKARDRKNRMDLKLPKVPFVPFVKRVEVNYSSKDNISKKVISSSKSNAVFDLYHIHPHGILKVASKEKIENDRLLPKLKNRAYFYLGIENLTKGAGFNLFMKFGASHLPEGASIDAQLEYLSGKNWVRINKDHIIENTFQSGLGNGMLTFRVPYDIDNQHPFYAKNKNWIRLSISNKYHKYIGNCLLLKTNSTKARRVRQNADASFQYINADTLTQFVNKDLHQFVKSIDQPMLSFGGKQKEKESLYYRRIAHRLSNKKRAVRPKDFVQLLHERFENIAWVKVATSTTNPQEVKPGEVHLVILPRFRTIKEFLHWKLKSELKEEMEKYLYSRSFPGIQIKVCSPIIEWIEVYVDIELNRFKNPPSIYHLSDIVDRTISPWVFSAEHTIEEADNPFNTIRVLNSLKNIKEIWRVEVCEAVQIIQKGNHFTYVDTGEGNEVLTPTTYRSIFLPADKHKIRFIQDASDCLKDNTIGNMMLGTDFILREEKEVLPMEDLVEEKEKGLYLLSSTK